MAKVRLTIYGPDREVEVPDGEVEGLRAQGLLIEDQPAEAPGQDKPAVAAPKEK